MHLEPHPLSLSLWRLGATVLRRCWSCLDVSRCWWACQGGGGQGGGSGDGSGDGGGHLLLLSSSFTFCTHSLIVDKH